MADNISLCEKIYDMVENSDECENPSCNCLLCFIKENMCICNHSIARMACDWCCDKICDDCLFYLKGNVCCETCFKNHKEDI